MKNSDQAMDKKSDVNLRKMMGWNLLNRGRLEDAAEVYTQTLNANPEEIDSLLMLANLYLASGDRAMAGLLHQQVYELDPQNPAIIMSLINNDVQENVVSRPVPTDAKTVAGILGRLTGKKDSIREEDVTHVANLIQQIITSDSPARMVSEHLAEIDELLPALIEINIRQAEADGRYDLAQGLKNLQENVILQIGEEKKQNPSLTNSAAAPTRPAEKKAFAGKVLLLIPPSLADARTELIQEALRGRGCQVNAAAEYQADAKDKPDVAIVSFAHTSPRVMESMASLTAQSVPIIVDLDRDFEHLPVNHQDYAKFGLSSPARSRAYTTELVLANQITINSKLLAQAVSYPTEFIPDGWSKENPLWTKTARPRDQIHIGWLNCSGHIEDLATIRRGIIRITREFANTQVYIVGDPQAYHLFDSIPDHRRTFLPEVEPAELPFQLSQIDILLAPIHNSPFHNTISDRLLMTAGARSIPWIASPIPSFKDWQEGGLIADGMDEWYLALRQLVMDADLRKNLSDKGKKAAEEREVTRLAPLWIDVIDKALSSVEGSAARIRP